jgi:hypothetical protein
MLGRLIGAVFASAVLAAGIAACGGGDDEGGSDDPATAATEILSSSDPATCARVTDNFIETLYGPSDDPTATCEDQISGSAPTDVEVSDVSVDGDTATGTVTSTGTMADFSMVNEDGEWKMDSLENPRPAEVSAPDTTSGG